MSPTSPALRLTLCLLGLMVALPFVQPIHHRPLPSFYEEWLAVMLGSLAWLTYLMSRPSQLQIPGIVWLPGVLLAATLLQLLTGLIQIPMLGIFQSGFLLWAALLAILSASLAQQLGRKKLLRVLALSILAGALGSALSAIFQRLETPLPGWLIMPTPGRVYGNMGQPNLLATYLWAGLLCLIHFREQQQIRLGFVLPGLLILATAIGFTASRTALLHGVVLLCLAAWYRPATLDAALWRQRLGILFSSLILVIAANALSRWLPWLHTANQVDAFDRLRAGLIGSDARLWIWRDTLTMILDHPWFGNGVGNYAYNNVSASARAPLDASTLAGCEHAHNFLLQIAADFGLPLALLITFLSARWLWRTAQDIRQNHDHARSNELLCALLCLIVIHSQLEYPLWHGEFLGLTAVMLGLLEYRQRTLQLPRLLILKSASLVVPLLLTSLFLDYHRLDQNLIIRPAEIGDEAHWKKRMQVFADLSLHSPLAPYARGTLAVLMEPNHPQAKQQSAICEAAMQLWISPVLMTKCAALRNMNGQTKAAETLLQLQRQAFRSQEEQSLIDELWQKWTTSAKSTYVSNTSNASNKNATESAPVPKETLHESGR